MKEELLQHKVDSPAPEVEVGVGVGVGADHTGADSKTTPVTRNSVTLFKPRWTVERFDLLDKKRGTSLNVL